MNFFALMNASISGSHECHGINVEDLILFIALFHSNVKGLHSCIPTFFLGNIQHMIRTRFAKNALPIVVPPQFILVESY